MEPYYAIMDFRIFLSPAFLELSMDAQTRFVQLVGTSDRMGVGNLYYVWNDSRIKADLMESLYKSDLVWPVDAYYCFIPSVFNANRKMRNGKYRSSFDIKGFQACIDKYPVLLQSMTESEKEYIKQHGILTGETTEVLPETQKAQAIEYKQTCDEEISKDPSNYINFEGVYMDRKDYAKYQALTMLYKDFEERNNVSILTEKDVAEWFMNLYSNDYRQGIAAARQRGVHLGRPVIAAPDNFGEMVKKWEKKQLSLEQILKDCNMSEATFYRRLRELRLLNNKK